MIGSEEAKVFVKIVLIKLGFKPIESFKPPEARVVCGKLCKFDGCWKPHLCEWDTLGRFAQLIGFRESKRRRKLELLLKLRHLPLRERYEEWTKHYVKAPNGRWAERAPKPRPKTPIGNKV